MEAKNLSIVIVNYNSPELIAACLRSIDQHVIGIKKEIIIVDNNSVMNNLGALTGQYSDLKVIYLPDNMGFGFANNVGVKNSNNDILLLLNSDTEFIDSSFNEMFKSFCDAQSCEIWGPRLIYPDGKFQISYSQEISFSYFMTYYTSLYSFITMFDFMNKRKYETQEITSIASVSNIYGAAVLMRKKDYEALGGFSRKYFMYFEDIDFCDRFREHLGGIIKYHPMTTLVHRIKGSSNANSNNSIFFKSKYIYAANKFGHLAIPVIFILDYIFSCIIIIVRQIKKISRY